MTSSGVQQAGFDVSVWKNLPTESGHFGAFGGRFVPETLMPALEEMAEAYSSAKEDPAFKAELERLLKHYVGRPTPTYFAERLSDSLGGARIYLKREDLAHTGAHKINNALGQGLLAKAMGKDRIIAETGAGQHGVAVATVCAMLDLECLVYMGEEDIRRQELNVFRMKILGAEVIPVSSGQPDSQRRHKRSHSRLGYQRSQYFLYLWIGRRAAPLSNDRSGLSGGYRPRSPRTDNRTDRPVARYAGRLRWRRQQRHGAVL